MLPSVSEPIACSSSGPFAGGARGSQSACAATFIIHRAVPGSTSSSRRFAGNPAEFRAVCDVDASAVDLFKEGGGEEGGLNCSEAFNGCA